MMASWETASIGDVCDVINGGTPKTDVPEYWGGPHHWITPAEMGKRATPYIDKTDRTITEQGLQNSSARPLPPYSVILSSRAPIGHLVINTEPMATNQGCKGLIPRSRIEYKFLYYYLSSIVGLLNDLGTGATFKELSGGKLKEVHIPVPPIPKQRRIVAILDEAFEAIATAKANAEKNLRNARELWDKQLDIFFATKDSSWREITLEEILYNQPRNGWSPPAANHSESGTPVLTLSAVTGFLFRQHKIKFTSAETNPNAHYWVKNGDLLLTRSNTPSLVGHVAIAEGLIEPTIYPDLIMRMTPDPSLVECKFLYYQLRTSYLREIITSRAQGANPTMVKLNKSSVQSLPISVPSLDVQRQIIDALENLSDQTQTLATIYDQKISALDELKKSLLHRAFTGQL